MHDNIEAPYQKLGINMTAQQLAAILNDNDLLKEKMIKLVDSWLNCGDRATICHPDIHLELFIDFEHQTNKKKFFFESGAFAKPEVTIYMTQYFEEGIPLRGNFEKSCELLWRDIAALAAAYMIAELENEPDPICEFRLAIGNRNQFGAVLDYWNETKTKLQF